MLKILLLISVIALSLFAAGDATFDATKRDLNVSAIIMFFVFIAGTLGVTYWAAKKTKSASDFYTAGGGITGFQNGLAIAGDYMSAAKRKPIRRRTNTTKRTTSVLSRYF